MTDNFKIESENTGNGHRFRSVSVPSVRAMFQIVAVGADVRMAPLAIAMLGNVAESKFFYDGFGEAALFANVTVPGQIATLEVRGGTQYAVGSGGTFFFRLELGLPGFSKRKLTQDEKNMTDEEWESSGNKAPRDDAPREDAPNWE
jgi:hypothetical protein